MSEVIYMHCYPQHYVNHQLACQLIKDWNTVILPTLKYKLGLLVKEMERSNYTNHHIIKDYLALVKEIEILSNAVQSLKSTHQFSMLHN